MPVLGQGKRRRVTAQARTLIGLVIALFAIGVALFLLLGGDDEGGAQGAGDTRPAASATAERIADNPARFLRRTVLTGGEISDVVGPSSYVVGAEGGLGGDGLLVVSREPRGIAGGGRPLLENDFVQIVGEVRAFDREELERELGRGLEDDLSERNGDPVLVADQIAVVPRLLPIGEPATIGRILARPRDYIGSIVTVEGRVSAVYERGALVLDNRIVVLLTRTVDKLPRRGERVRVTGAVRPYDIDELAARTRDDVDDDLFGDLVERPAVVAYGIERGVR